MSADIKTFSSTELLLDYFTDAIKERLLAGINERGRAYLVVSGGRTPVPLFERLAQLSLSWEKVTVLLADDRWVPVDHPDSNERLVRQTLLQQRAEKAQFIGLMGAGKNIKDDVAKANEKLRDLPSFDVVILGMGDDGHTASLFPCSKELNEGLQSVAPALAVTPVTAPHQRISLSFSRLINCHQLYLHVKGAGKSAVVNKAMQSGETASLPISLFLNQSAVPMQVLQASD